MGGYLIRRLLWLVPTILGIVLIISLMLEVIPGDPVLMMLSETASNEMRVAVRHQLGLDKTFSQRFGIYVWRLVHGNLGRSFMRGEKVSKLIGKTFSATVQLTLGSLFLMLLIGVPLGVLSALYPRSKFDFMTQGISLVGVSMPAFWIGLVLIYLFAYLAGLFPLGGKGGAVGLILPAFSLSLSSIGFIIRTIRANMLEVMGMEYITTARSKGILESTVIWKHAFRNAILPVLTVIGLQFGRLLGGAVVTEVVFSWPGMGRLIVNAINTRDYPLVQGAILVFGLAFVCLNLLIDVSYTLLDPRVKYG